MACTLCWTSCDMLLCPSLCTNSDLMNFTQEGSICVFLSLSWWCFSSKPALHYWLVILYCIYFRRTIASKFIIWWGQEWCGRCLDTSFYLLFNHLPLMIELRHLIVPVVEYVSNLLLLNLIKLIWPILKKARIFLLWTTLLLRERLPNKVIDLFLHLQAVLPLMVIRFIDTAFVYLAYLNSLKEACVVFGVSSTACGRVASWFASVFKMVYSSIQLFNFLKELLDAVVFALEFFLHQLYFILFIDAPNDFIDIELKANVTHFFVLSCTSYDLRRFHTDCWCIHLTFTRIFLCSGYLIKVYVWVFSFLPALFFDPLDAHIQMIMILVILSVASQNLCSLFVTWFLSCA